jgi:transcriptional regulator with XRE-family HTH domain
VSRFSQTLDRLIGGRTQQEIADLTGVKRPMISLWISGERHPEPESVDQLLLAFTSEQCLELVHAYLLDWIPASMRDTVQVIVRRGEKFVDQVDEDPGPYGREFKDALNTLAAAGQDKENRAVVLDLARILKRVNDAEAKIADATSGPAELIDLAVATKTPRGPGPGAR